MAVEDGATSKSADHSKQRQLAKVKHGTGWQCSSQEEYYWSRCTGVQLLKSFQLYFVVVVQCFLFCLTEDQGCKAAEKNWKTIELLHSESCSSVTMVVSSNASW
jgi:hypothetical protein